jgi:glycosyltransferase involved in cell wall biosynthesis
MSTAKTKIILLVPVHNVAKRFAEWEDCIYQLRPKPTKVIFCENNSYDNTLELLKNFSLPHEIIRFWIKDDAQAHQGPYCNIAHARQLLLTRARHLDPDYAIFVDDDIYITTPSALQIMASHKKDIVGGTYLRLFPEGLFIASKWKYPDGRIQLRDWVEEPFQEIHMTSGGFLCLSREVIQDRRLHFFPLLDDESAEDFGFCLLAHDLNYKTYLDGIVRLQHGDRHRHRPWFTVGKDDTVHKGIKLGRFEYVQYEFSKERDDYVRVRLVPIYERPEGVKEEDTT